MEAERVEWRGRRRRRTAATLWRDGRRYAVKAAVEALRVPGGAP